MRVRGDEERDVALVDVEMQRSRPRERTHGDGDIPDSDAGASVAVEQCMNAAATRREVDVTADIADIDISARTSHDEIDARRHAYEQICEPRRGINDDAVRVGHDARRRWRRGQGGCFDCVGLRRLFGERRVGLDLRSGDTEFHAHAGAQLTDRAHVGCAAVTAGESGR